MSSKRNLSESDEFFTKKARFVDDLSSNEVLKEEKAMSHGEATFGANTDFNGDSDSEINGLAIDCFDDFDCSDEQNRQPVAGPMTWIQRHIELCTDPRQILQEMLPSDVILPEHLDLFMMWKLIFDLLMDPQPRQKLPDINTLGQVLTSLKTCKNVLVLTGAGVSVSCGIPDFRSRDGIYARLSEEYPDMPDPQAMFDIKYFQYNPKPFYKFANEIYPGKFKPSLSHRFIHQLEKNGRLLRNYTQNIDTLEREAGITRVIECHGSFSTASCTRCKYRVTANAIRNDIVNQEIPLCPKCPVSEDYLSVMKPDIVFFGESLPQTFHDCIEQDINQVDLLIVIGSSLKVRPVNLIPNQIPPNIPQILINREPLSHMNFDVELLGDCDTIIADICRQLGEPWNQVLQGYKIPNVSEEFLAPFLQTRPDLPEQCQKRGLIDGEFVDSGCGFNNKVENDDRCSLEQSQNYVKEVSHIFLPPCRYIFHGAEIGRCDSPLFDDDSDCSNEINEKNGYEDLVRFEEPELTSDVENCSREMKDKVDNDLISFECEQNEEKLNNFNRTRDFTTML